jgi:transcriptional regulator GlxA family with amidase domain
MTRAPLDGQLRGIGDVLIVAVREAAGSALYGMLAVLMATGNIWQTLLRSGDERQYFRVRIVSPDGQLFTCGNRIPVNPDFAIRDEPIAPIVILPELWLGPDETMTGRYPDLIEWIKRRHADGSTIYSACSGAGGTTSWHDLALHLIARHVGPTEALRIAKVYLLKWHDEGELSYTALVRPLPHGDGTVRKIEALLKEHFRDQDAIVRAVKAAAIPERTIKRRFKAATGLPLIDYLQNIRIEHGKHLLETTRLPVEDIVLPQSEMEKAFLR